MLVPKHILLSENDKNEVLKKYGSLKQFPRILLTDPAIKNMNPQVGDLIKIVRNSQTAKEAIYYRVVVRG